MRSVPGAALLLLVPSCVLAAESVFLVDSPFDQVGVRQPTRVYAVDVPTGALTLKANIGDAYTPVLGLAAANATVLYGIGSDNVDDADGPCFACLLIRVVLDPQSTTPQQVTAIGRVQAEGDTVIGFTGLTFRSNGDLYGVSEDTEALYLIDPNTAEAMEVGTLNVDEGSGCTTTVLDVTGGDLVFDALDRLWAWNNTPMTKGLWEINPENACAFRSSSCPSSRNMSGLAVVDHTSVSPVFSAPSPQDDRLYPVVPAICPMNGEPTSKPLTRNGAPFDHSRGDLDFPYCENDLACDDASACTTDLCSPGGCHNDLVSCDDGDACTDDACDPGSGCQYVPHPCDDGNACTDDSCDPASGCQYVPHACDDGDACTDDACDPLTGCQYVPHACDDGDACTDDACDPLTGCQYVPHACDDGDACTDDSCATPTGCTFAPNTDPCDDGDTCTTGDACSGGSCAGAPVVLEEVQGLLVEQPLDEPTALRWTGQGVGPTYDLVSGLLSQLGGPGGIVSAMCLASGLPGPLAGDERPLPDAGDGYYYLVRSAGACGVGPYGHTSSGQERIPAVDCP